ncbi:hypothetical protein [Streptomyces sp. CB02115]|uniref:hypothetical protein n=1 Tax=Streptomyces sp. CB02115 TaxID=1703939 RepID=UPI00093E0619|nr:hypothetical protein [Streptomyces sp. CB02115]OKJ54317.1 hypothetical protein AMK28_19605 [Streptomyces sp. CB02115]
MPSGLPVAIWHVLRTRDRIRLAPFRQPGSPAAIGGEAAAASLGPLAAVQLDASARCRTPTNAQLWPVGELAAWQLVFEEQWCSSDSWQGWDAICELGARLPGFMP